MENKDRITPAGEDKHRPEGCRMSKVKLFTENFLVYGFGGIIAKLIPLVMVPVVTRLMPDSTYFGLSDLSTTVVALASSLAIIGMYDAMFRMFFDKEDEGFQKDICSTALLFTLGTSIVVFVLMLLGRNWIARFFFGDRQYAYLVYITATATLVSATNSIISAPTRIQNKRTVFLVTNTVGPLLSYGVAIPLLLHGYYVIALPLALMISGVTMEAAFLVLNRKWFSPRRFNKKLLRQMLAIAVPLFPNFLIYWVFNSSDRLMITNVMSIAAAGIYSVGSKLGSASQLIYMAFAGGWQYFAFSTMKEENQVASNSKVFEYLGILSFAAFAFVCGFSYWIFKTLFVGEYVEGYIVAPYLFLAPLLQMLFQVACNQFIVIKKTWPNLFILSGGAALNIVLNLFLIPVLGIEGAAIASLIGYIVSVAVAVAVLYRMKLIVLSGRFLAACIAVAAYFIAWRMLFNNNTLLGAAFAALVTAFFLYLYRKELRWLLCRLTAKRKARQDG